MSCEQSIFKSYIPAYKPFDISNQNSLADCSQKCCETNDENGSCGIYSYWPGKAIERAAVGTRGGADPGRCHLYQLPDQPLYLPLPSVKNMIPVKSNVITGILMKRKITTWIPLVIIIILFGIVIFGLVFDRKNGYA